MRYLKSALVVVFSMSLLGSSAPPLQAATYKIKWLLGHENLDAFEEAALEFKKTIETETNGDIQIDIVMKSPDRPAQGYGSAPEIAARVAKGEAEMGHSFVDVIGGLDPQFKAFKAPFLFRNYRHQEGVFEGAVGHDLLEGLRAHGIVGLCFNYSGGFSGIATIDRELRRPEDLKGLRVGVFGDDVDAAWLNAVGASPVPIGHKPKAILPLARRGVVDAVEITWRNFEIEGLNTDFKHMSMLSFSYLASVTYINEKFFDSLPQEYQELLSRESLKSGRIERAQTIKLNENAKRAMMGKGIRSVPLTEKNRARFVKILEPVYKTSIERMIGEKLIRRIRNTPDAAKYPGEFAKR